MKKVAILGSTGSIGTQTLQVIKSNADRLKVWSLVAYSNREKLLQQVTEFSPHFYGLIAQQGENVLVDAVKGADIAVVATRGITALKCVEYCLTHGIDVALANKEVLVTAGSYIMSLQSENARIIPVDSEHCAISQCLAGRNAEDVSKILLTASGGAFYDTSDLSVVTAEDALKHPTWNMGAKITVDSATMVNKSFEVIEASHLFAVPVEKIEIVVHRQSIVHSAVEFVDGSVIMQSAVADMRLPIQLALLGKHRDTGLQKLCFAGGLQLTFCACDTKRFPCAKLGYEVSKRYALAPTVMNAVNDVCVDAFLDGRFAFTDFYKAICCAVNELESTFANTPLTVDNVIDCDKKSKEFTKKIIVRQND